LRSLAARSFHFIRILSNLCRPQIAYRTPLAVGFIVGVGVMMIQVMLLNAVMAAGEHPLWQAHEALAAFSALKVIGLVSADRLCRY
jgi:hypothetical protein